MKKQTLNNYVDTLILFFCGFIVFSPISSQISINILHLPLALPEVLFFPFYFKLRKLFNLKPNSKILFFGSFIIIFLIAISLIVGLFPFTSILSTARGYFYMLLVFSIFKNKMIPNINYIFYIVFGSSVAWMVIGMISLNRLISSTYQSGFSAVYGNMIALALMISITIIYKKKLLTFIALGIAIVIALTSGLRRQISIAFISYVLSFLTQIRFSIKRIFYPSILIFVFATVILFLYPVAMKFTYSISPTLYTRIFVKTEQLLTGQSNASDQTRLNSFHTFSDNIEDYILPRGFVSKRTMQDKGTGLFMDSPYIEFFHTFGLFFSIPLIIYIFSRFKFHFKNYYRNKINESAINFVMAGVIFALMLIEGSFLNFAYTTPITGFVFARIASTKNLVK